MTEEEHIQQDPWWKGPMKYILGSFLLLIIIVWAFAPYAAKVDPEPSYIPTIDEVVISNLSIESVDHNINSNLDFKRFINPNDAEIKDIAARIASKSCSGEKVCQAKAIFYFVRDNFDYISDPDIEYVESAKEVLMTGGSDCDGLAVLLANLESAIGVDTRLVFVPGHVYVELKLDKGPGKYLEWFPADPTCKTCRMGEIPTYYESKEVLTIS